MFQHMETLIHQFALITDGPPTPKGELYVATETPRGEFGIYVVSDGSGKPYRMKFRTPSLSIFRPSHSCAWAAGWRM